MDGNSLKNFIIRLGGIMKMMFASSLLSIQQSKNKEYLALRQEIFPSLKPKN
jgi:hypothetical protein